jgi:phosphate transport system substrate-binding protein
MKNQLWAACLAAVLFAGCDSSPKPANPDTGQSADALPTSESNLVGAIKIDGSSTVQPISNAVSEMFRSVHPQVEVSVSGNGTGNGFKTFYDKGSDISDASRPIKPNEFKSCQENGVSFIELPVAYDGLTIAVNPKNDWAKELTIDQLKKMFVGDEAAKNWSDVDPSWPKEPIKIFAPGTGSGTYDYFYEVVAKSDDKQLRGDMTLNEDDNILVQGVASNKFSIGFFGVAYYTENKDKLRAVPIVNPEDKTAYEPTVDNISANKYAPFSRPLFIYVNADSLNRAEVQTFVEFYLENVSDVCQQANSVRMPDATIEHAKANFEAMKLGTHFVTEDGESREGAFQDLFADENLVK